MRSYVKTVLGRIEESFSKEEIELFSSMLMRISAEMMPEAGNFETAPPRLSPRCGFLCILEQNAEPE